MIKKERKKRGTKPKTNPPMITSTKNYSKIKENGQREP